MTTFYRDPGPGRPDSPERQALIAAYDRASEAASKANSLLVVLDRERFRIADEIKRFDYPAAKDLL